MIARLALALATGVTAGAAQSLEQRVAAAPDGEVRFAYAARPGVCGNGHNIVSWDCRPGKCNRTVRGDFSSVDRDEWQECCEPGPVRVTLSLRRGTVTRVKVAVGGAGRAAAGRVTDLGTVPVREAVRYFLGLARRPEAGEDAIFPATLADSVEVWPDLVRLARDDGLPTDTRRQAVFWLGQAAGAAATRELDALTEGDQVDREVKEAAVFALSQRPHDEGVPVLLRVARTNRDPEVRRKAIFWLAQSGDPRAVALFEELLTKP
ncbi:MAG: HEAT repeat domain-containing protein [Gemmatimonadales bacterium]